MGDEISIVMGLSSVIPRRLCRSEKIPHDWKKILSGGSNKLIVLIRHSTSKNGKEIAK